MAEDLATLLEVRLGTDGALSGRLSCSKRIAPAPGQYLLAQPAGEMDVCATALFPASLRGGEIEIAPPLPPSWVAGACLSISGPHGNGFHLPPQACRVALAAPDGCARRLAPLMDLSLAQSADVVLYLDEIPDGLPAVVEVQPFSQLPAALSWTDYLALDLHAAQLEKLRGWLGLQYGQLSPCPVAVLVRDAFPCGGLADCGACAVKTRRGWKLACKDGPVFDFNELET